MQLGRQVKLLHSAMLIEDSVLVLHFPKREELVILVHTQFAAIVTHVGANILVRSSLLFGLRKGPLEVGVAVVRLQRRVWVLLLFSIIALSIVLRMTRIMVWGRRIVHAVGITAPRSAKVR